MPDIDLDFPNRSDILDIIEHVPASLKDGKRHNTGVYCHRIPKNPLTGNATLNYHEADKRGYFKIDFLNVGVYKGVKSEKHLIELMNKEPIWDLLLQEDFVNMLFHLNGHVEILKKTKPNNVEQLAAVLAMIRPAKRHLVGKDWKEIFKEVWIKPTNGDYYFKKAHAIGYAMAVVVQMNLICEQLMVESSSGS